MLKKLLIGLIVIAAAQLALAILLYRWMGWWAIPILLVINIVTGPFITKRALKALFLMPFKMKGAALAGATAVVNSVEPAPEPARRDEDDDDEDDDEGPREHYYVDVTIAPKASQGGGFSHWEPGELVLVRPGAKAIPGDDDEDEVGSVRELLVWSGTEFGPDDDYKYEGERRLRLHVAVVPGTREARFRYYFEIFGDVRFPSAATLGTGA